MKLGFLIILALIAGIRVSLWMGRTPGYRDGDTLKITAEIRQFPKQVSGGWAVNVYGLEVVVPSEVGVGYGDKLVVIGKVADKVTSSGQHKKILIVGDFNVTRGKGVVEGLASWRGWAMDRIEEWLPGDFGGLASGIFLGGSGGLSYDTVVSFRRTGLSHIVAASGFNVTMVASWVLAAGAVVVGKRRAIYFAIVCICLYVFVAGLSAAVIRAGIMAVLILMGLLAGRRVDSRWNLVCVGLAMIVVNPGFIVDVGWQLSLASMVGLVWVVPALGDNLWGAEVKATLAAQLTTLPLIWHYFGQVSVVAPLANVLLAWVVPAIMQIVGLAILAGVFLPAVGQLVAYLAWPLLWWMLTGVQLISKFDWVVVNTNRLGWGWVVVYYGVLVALVMRYEKSV